MSFTRALEGDPLVLELYNLQNRECLGQAFGCAARGDSGLCLDRVGQCVRDDRLPAAVSYRWRNCSGISESNFILQVGLVVVGCGRHDAVRVVSSGYEEPVDCLQRSVLGLQQALIAVFILRKEDGTLRVAGKSDGADGGGAGADEPWCVSWVFRRWGLRRTTWMRGRFWDGL